MSHLINFDNLQQEYIEDTYTELLLNLPSPAFIKNRSGQYVFINNELEAFWSKPADAVLGKTDFDIMPYDEAKECESSDEAPWQKPGQVFTSFETQYDENGHIKSYVSVNKRATYTPAGEFLIGIVTTVNV